MKISGKQLEKYKHLVTLETSVTKCCTRCLELKPLSDFHQDKSKRKGCRSFCRVCANGKRDASRQEQYRILRELETESTKACPKCFTIKPLSEFSYDSTHRKNRQSYCKQCSQSNHYEQKYDITLEEFNSRLSQQNDCCSICGAHYSNSRSGKLAVDHCHKTGKVRELLCISCNGGLGLFKDDPDVLRRAAQYLEKHNE